MPQTIILVVDDNQENRTVLSRRLAHDGYQVLPAASGAQALETLELQAVSLVLLDLQMPDMDGLEVLAHIRKKKDEVQLPVFMVSANTDQGSKVAAMELGANDYLPKPLEYDFLLSKLKRLFKSHTTGNHSDPVPSSATTTLNVGDALGHYRLLGLLGEGGMGRVYRATDERLLRDVALKVMSGEMRPESQQRFLMEARAVARVSHPNVVTIYEISEAPVPYLAMELVEGVELEDFAQRRPLPPKMACQLVIQIAEALQAVHQRGILHRDLKPANIMICGDQRVKVMDFGLAKIAELNQKLTRTGDIWGTPQYMSPEHFDPSRGEVDSQSDLFALGAIFYEMLTGHPPFQSTAMAALIFEILSKKPKAPSDIVPDIPQELSDLCLKGISKAKKDRFSSAGEMARALRELQKEAP